MSMCWWPFFIAVSYGLIVRFGADPLTLIMIGQILLARMLWSIYGANKELGTG